MNFMISLYQQFDLSNLIVFSLFFFHKSFFKLFFKLNVFIIFVFSYFYFCQSKNLEIFKLISNAQISQSLKMFSKQLFKAPSKAMPDFKIIKLKDAFKAIKYRINMAFCNPLKLYRMRIKYLWAELSKIIIVDKSRKKLQFTF